MTPPPTDTIAASEPTTGSAVPGIAVIGLLGLAFVGGLRLATVRARR